MIRYANVAGLLCEPSYGLRGICPGCGNPVTAKCGLIKIHHWAHLKNKECDPWWEPMTQWHLDWQNKFPEQWREKIIKDEQSGTFHRADIHTPNGVTIEFQHSAMPAGEIERRNAFYGKVIWVVNGKRFAQNFRRTSLTLDPESPLLANYNFHVDKNGMAKETLYYVNKKYFLNPPSDNKLGLDQDELDAAQEEQERNGKVFSLFEWDYRHQTWLNCSMPVFLDFGDDFLYWIKKRQQVSTPLFYTRIFKKEEFLAKYTKDLIS